MSSDYSFWRLPVNDVPKCYNGTKSPDIRFAQRCSDDLSTSCGVGDYCPNSSQNNSNCLHFFCSQSKTCIEHDKTCDGICHCQYCEDEYFEGLCQLTFPEAATIKCIESNRSLDTNITIMAIPCNGVRECLDVDDEDCESKWFVTPIVWLVFFLLICSGWGYTHFKATIRSDECTEKLYQTNMMPQPRKKGDALAKLKVQSLENLKLSSTVSKINCYLFRMSL